MSRNNKNKIKYYRTCKRNFFQSQEEYNSIASYNNWLDNQDKSFICDCVKYASDIALSGDILPDISDVPDKYKEYYKLLFDVLGCSQVVNPRFILHTHN